MKVKEIKLLVTIECEWCEGNKVCRWCQGTGKTMDRECFTCTGTGDCDKCLAKGEVVRIMEVA